MPPRRSQTQRETKTHEQANVMLRNCCCTCCHLQQLSEDVHVCRAKFDKFTPRLEDRIDPHVAVPFGEMFGQGVDDMIGGVSLHLGSD